MTPLRAPSLVIAPSPRRSEGAAADELALVSGNAGR